MALPIDPIQKRDNYICQYCNKDGLASLDNWHDCVIDHFVPPKPGDKEDPDNLVTSCHYCNSIKGDKRFASIDDAKAFIRKRRQELQLTFEAVKKAVRGSDTPNASMSLEELQNQTIVFKITGFPKAMSGTLVSVDDAGIWVSSQELPSEIAQAGALTRKAPTRPVLFVPFSQLLYLVVSEGNKDVE